MGERNKENLIAHYIKELEKMDRVFEYSRRKAKEEIYQLYLKIGKDISKYDLSNPESCELKRYVDKEIESLVRQLQGFWKFLRCFINFAAIVDPKILEASQGNLASVQELKKRMKSIHQKKVKEREQRAKHMLNCLHWNKGNQTYHLWYDPKKVSDYELKQLQKKKEEEEKQYLRSLGGFRKLGENQHEFILNFRPVAILRLIFKGNHPSNFEILKASIEPLGDEINLDNLLDQLTIAYSQLSQYSPELKEQPLIGGGRLLDEEKPKITIYKGIEPLLGYFIKKYEPLIKKMAMKYKVFAELSEDKHEFDEDNSQESFMCFLESIQDYKNIKIPPPAYFKKRVAGKLVNEYEIHSSVIRGKRSPDVKIDSSGGSLDEKIAFDENKETSRVEQTPSLKKLDSDSYKRLTQKLLLFPSIEERQKEIVLLLYKGFTEKGIAERLSISTKTIQREIRKLCNNQEFKNLFEDLRSISSL